MFATDSGSFLYKIRGFPEVEAHFEIARSSRIFLDISSPEVGQSQSLRDKCRLVSNFTGRLFPGYWTSPECSVSIFAGPVSIFKRSYRHVRYLSSRNSYAMSKLLNYPE